MSIDLYIQCHNGVSTVHWFYVVCGVHWQQGIEHTIYRRLRHTWARRKTNVPVYCPALVHDRKQLPFYGYVVPKGTGHLWLCE